MMQDHGPDRSTSLEAESRPRPRVERSDNGLDQSTLTRASLAEPGRRIYVNRNLRFGDIRWVGLDLDYTVARYAKRELESLSFEMTKRRMVELLGYPRAVLDLPYDADFVARGLTIDKQLGNILKVDRHGYVGRAYHGRQELSRAERHRLYRSMRVRLYSARYHWVDTLFALPEASLFASIVDLRTESEALKSWSYTKIFDDIRTSMDACHADGTLKAVVTGDIDRYLIFDPYTPRALEQLRSSGKRLFLLTNSEWTYTDAILRHLLDDKLSGFGPWQSFFDLVIVEAKKPLFFRDHLLFHRVDISTGRTAEDPVDRLEYGGVYQGGSIQELGRAQPDLYGERVLYVGDHIYGDIIRSKKDTLWRTALVVEELEEELLLHRELSAIESDLEALHQRRALVQDRLNKLRVEIGHEDEPASHSDEIPLSVGGRIRRQRLLLLEREEEELVRLEQESERLRRLVDTSYNKYWGSVFRSGDEQSRFAAQVEEFACIYTSRISNLFFHSPAEYFRKPRHWMAHEKER